MLRTSVAVLHAACKRQAGGVAEGGLPRPKMRGGCRGPQAPVHLTCPLPCWDFVDRAVVDFLEYGPCGNLERLQQSPS